MTDQDASPSVAVTDPLVGLGQLLGGQHVLVLGLGISGLSMARWCLRLGASVTVIDSRAAPPSLADLMALQAAGGRISFVQQDFTAVLIDGTDVRAVFKSPGLTPVAVVPLVQAAKRSGLWVGNELSLFNHALAQLKSVQGYDPKVLGVTGTNGKTTVTALTGQLVARAGKSVAVAGNIGPALLDTLMQRMEDLPQVWVLELSSFQLDGVADFAPTAATVLNITQDHLDWHGSMAAYAAAKENIYGQRKQETQIHVSSGLPTQVGGWGLELAAGMHWLVRAVADGDEAMLPSTKSKRSKAAQLPQTFTLQRLMPADALRIRGIHNATNALAALALACKAGCALAPMLYGLREYQGEPHRMETVAVHEGIEYIDDSKGTNVGATVAALSSLGQGQSRKKIILILGGDGKGQDFTPLQEPVHQWVKAVVLMGRDAGIIAQTLADHLPPGDFCQTAEDLPDAVRRCVPLASSGDCVLLSPACASLDMFQDYKHRAEVFVQAVKGLVVDAGGVL